MDKPWWDRFGRWLVCWAIMAEGFINVLTFTYANCSWGLDAARILAKKRIDWRADR